MPAKSKQNHTVGCMCALVNYYAAAQPFLDGCCTTIYKGPCASAAKGYQLADVLGRIGKHNTRALAVLPVGCTVFCRRRVVVKRYALRFSQCLNQADGGLLALVWRLSRHDIRPEDVVVTAVSVSVRVWQGVRWSVLASSRLRQPAASDAADGTLWSQGSL